MRHVLHVNAETGETTEYDQPQVGVLEAWPFAVRADSDEVFTIRYWDEGTAQATGNVTVNGVVHTLPFVDGKIEVEIDAEYPGTITIVAPNGATMTVEAV